MLFTPKIEIIDAGQSKKKQSSSVSWLAFVQNNKVAIVLGVAAVFLFFLGIFALFLANKKDNERVEIIPVQDKTATVAGVYIDLSGAVQKPGLYHLPGDSRVNDLLVAAGGLSADADREWFGRSINLAQKLVDGIKIYIPAKNNQTGLSTAGEQTKTADGYQKININLANKTELEKLPGIGPSTAQKIIDYRSQHGFFAKTEDIQQVPGIGEKTYAELQNYIAVF